MAEQYLTIQDPEFHLVQVSTAQKALQLLDEESFDAVICDFYLGPNQLNGLQILEWMRENESTTPFIIFTGRSREEIAIQALNLGADYYIEKGDDLEGLFTEIGYHIKKVVRSRRTEEALQESEQRYRTLVQSLNDLIFVLDSEDRFSQYHAVSGGDLVQELGDIIDKPISEVMPSMIADKYIALKDKVRESGERQSFDFETTIDGQKRWFIADLDLHEDKESIVVTVGDITKIKKAEHDLRSAEREWKNTFDSI
ncbi:MAG: response regulator, partial [Candidatus Thorarchaeota archaeon]